MCRITTAIAPLAGFEIRLSVLTSTIMELLAEHRPNRCEDLREAVCEE